VLFQDFLRGLDRIRRRLGETDFTGDFLSWDQEYPAGSPRHEEARFAFKPFCFLEADRGYVRRFDEPPASAANTR